MRNVYIFLYEFLWGSVCQESAETPELLEEGAGLAQGLHK